MSPLDGAYNSPTEIVAGVIDTSTLSPGRHIVYVHGFDAAGNLGPPHAVYVDVP